MYEDYIYYDDDGIAVLIVSKWAEIKDEKLQTEVLDYFMNLSNGRMEF